MFEFKRILCFTVFVDSLLGNQRSLIGDWLFHVVQQREQSER
jgi:hypothetical protein